MVLFMGVAVAAAPPGDKSACKTAAAECAGKKKGGGGGDPAQCGAYLANADCECGKKDPAPTRQLQKGGGGGKGGKKKKKCKKAESMVYTEVGKLAVEDPTCKAAIFPDAPDRRRRLQDVDCKGLVKTCVGKKNVEGDPASCEEYLESCECGKKEDPARLRNRNLQKGGKGKKKCKKAEAMVYAEVGPLAYVDGGLIDGCTGIFGITD